MSLILVGGRLNVRLSGLILVTNRFNMSLFGLVLMVDHDSAYKAMAQVKRGTVVLAFCYCYWGLLPE